MKISAQNKTKYNSDLDENATIYSNPWRAER